MSGNLMPLFAFHLHLYKMFATILFFRFLETRNPKKNWNLFKNHLPFNLSSSADAQVTVLHLFRFGFWATYFRSQTLTVTF